MRRPLKFRAWNTVTKSMIPDALEIGNIGLGEGSVVIDSRAQTGDELIWLQFTGLHDKFGKEIYEADILKQDYQGQNLVGVMDWHKAKAQFGMIANVDIPPEKSPNIEITESKDGLPEIIGNFFESPELLTQGQ